MTWREWFVHLRFWLRMWPRKSDDHHTYVGVAGCNISTCLICHVRKVDPEEDRCCAECEGECEDRQASYEGMVA